MKKISLILISLFILFIPYNVKAYDYVITNYDMNIVINENNSFQIKETIDANFIEQRHGIIRTIPTTNNVKRLDGSVSKNYARITDLNVSENFTDADAGGYKKIQIGDALEYVTGPKQYTIEYLYKLSNDNSKKYDEVYFNIIGDQWDTTISNVTFSITMPKEFDKDKIGFAYGPSGSTLNDKVKYEVNGNVITGSLDAMLNPEESFTVRLELPEGYFLKDKMTNLELLGVILPIVFIVISLLLWKIYGDDDIVVDSVNFYPPDNLNSLDIGYLYEGKSKSEHVTSLLVYLANKGYLTIEEEETKILFTSVKGFKLTKLREYAGTDESERTFFMNLFLYSSSKNEYGQDVVYSKDLKNLFYMTINKIVNSKNSKKNRKQFFDVKADWMRFVVKLMIVVTFISMLYIPICNLISKDMILLVMITSATPFVFIFGFIALAVKALTQKNLKSIFIFLFVIIVLGGNVFSFFGNQLGSYYFSTYYSKMIMIVSFSSIIILTFMANIMPKRNKYAIDILGRINGFKNFLETAEKPRLEALVLENPNYFYDILPYTYVLGVSKLWISRFEGLLNNPPTWYRSTRPFDPYTFDSFLDKSMNSSDLNSRPSSSGSGGSGGGFSGGGSGGGGGSSW